MKDDTCNRHEIMFEARYGVPMRLVKRLAVDYMAGWNDGIVPLLNRMALYCVEEKASPCLDVFGDAVLCLDGLIAGLRKRVEREHESVVEMRAALTRICEMSGGWQQHPEIGRAKRIAEAAIEWCEKRKE